MSANLQFVDVTLDIHEKLRHALSFPFSNGSKSIPGSKTCQAANCMPCTITVKHRISETTKDLSDSFSPISVIVKCQIFLYFPNSVYLCHCHCLSFSNILAS